MTNNEVNAWKGHRSVPQPLRATWGHLYDSENNENPTSTAFGQREKHVEVPHSYLQGQISNNLREPDDFPKGPSQPTYIRSVPMSSPQYDRSMHMDFTEAFLPPAGQEITDCSPNLDLGSFFDTSVPSYAYQVPTHASYRPVDSFPAAVQRPLSSLSYSIDRRNSSSDSSSTVYSGYSLFPTNSFDMISGPFTALDVEDNSVDTWWAGMSGNGGSMNVLDMAQSISCDGLPRDFEPWASSPPPPPTAEEVQYCDPLHTISPKALVSPTFHNLDSVQAVHHDSCNKRTSIPDLVVDSPPVIHQTHPSTTTPANRPRRKLPDKPIGRTYVSILPSNDSESLKSEKKSRPRSKKTSSSRPSRSRFPDVEVNDKDANRIESDEDLASNIAKYRETKDEFLVKSKRAGMSYRDIRRQGGFSEAESTLRGRYRTLTKKREERVRRPLWTDKDNALLKRAVRKYLHGSDPSKTKIPWKKVAEYIDEKGGSYHFGNATCRKQWDELQGGAGR